MPRIAMVNPKKKGTKRKATRRKKGKSTRRKNLTPYQSFVKTQMPKLRKQHPAMKNPSLMKKIGGLWRAKTGTAKKANPKRRKSARKKPQKRKARKKSNAGTPAGARKGWKRRKAPTTGYKKGKGGKYPKTPGTRPKYGKKRKAAKRKPVKRKKAPKKRKATSKKRKPAKRKKAPAKRRKTTRKKPAKKKSTRRKTKGTRKTTKRKATKKRKNPAHAVASKMDRHVGKYTRKAGFPKFATMFPTFHQIRAHKLATVGGVVIGAGSSNFVGGVFVTLAPENLAVPAGITGNVVGTEAAARLYKRTKFGKSNAHVVKAIRLGGYGSILVTGLYSVIKTSGGLSGGVGSLVDTVKTTSRSIATKAKSALGISGWRRKGGGDGLEDLVTSGYQQGYVGYEPLGVSDASDGVVSQLQTRIRALQEDLGLSNTQVTEIAREEGLGFLDLDMSGVGASVVPPAREDVFDSSFV